MQALCLITVKPGKVDAVVEILKKKRKTSKKIMIVTGRADISVILRGKMVQINQMVIDFTKIIALTILNLPLPRLKSL